jgi:hypothetical protein
MYSINPSDVPAEQAGYVPYFYQAGLYLRYDLAGIISRKGPHDRTSSSYDFSSDVPLFAHMGLVQTVEQVIARGYFAVPQANPISALISDKAHTAKFGLDDVIHQIRSRYELYQRNIEELHESLCEAHNCVFRQMADHGQLVANQRQQYSASKQVQKIYELQREERVNLWRDVSRLKLGLPESAQQYLTAYRKVRLLTENPGDEP